MTPRYATADDTTARLSPEPIVGAAIGVLIGVGGSIWVWELYPPTSAHLLPMALVSIGSVAIVLIGYAISAGLRRGRAGDWLVLGFGAVLIVAASLAMGREVWQFLADHMPGGLVP